ncbi:MAG: SAM-dependent methyltransferase [Candidatus Nitrosocosmicus sp.]|nr:SAM-dependent methyltransferase [Candidatus Nitrosocosmicus sp.]
MTKKLYLIGVGPGSKKYLTDFSKEIIKQSPYIIGYKYTLNTIDHLLDRAFNQVFEITMKNQEEIYLNVYNNLMKENDVCTVPFTGDVNFSESEVVDRLLYLFGDENVYIIPGISSIQVAAAKSRVPLDKSNIMTFHVTGDIEEK